MGTLHRDTGELHGITVVVDTHGPEVWVGRCMEITDAGVVLVDADVHREGEGGRSKQDYLARAAKLGVWKKHARVVVPREQVASVQPLGRLAAPGGGDLPA